MGYARLIIPLRIFSSQVKFILFFIGLQSIWTTLKAQIYGCHVQRSGSEVIYFTPYGLGSPAEWQTTVSGRITAGGETGGYRNDGTVTYGCIRDVGGVCTVYQQYEINAGPPQLVGMRIYKLGIYASIEPENCPIDNYISVIVILFAGLIFYKRKNFFATRLK